MFIRSDFTRLKGNCHLLMSRRLHFFSFFFNHKLDQGRNENGSKKENSCSFKTNNDLPRKSNQASPS